MQKDGVYFSPLLPQFGETLGGEGFQFAQISRGLIPVLRRVAGFHLAELMSRWRALDRCRCGSALIRMCMVSSEVLDALEGIPLVIAST